VDVEGRVRPALSAKDTRVHLVAELEALLPAAGSTKAAMIRELIAKAKAGEFHDYKSEQVCGKVYCVELLRRASLGALARRVMEGEFDEEADAEDRAAMALDFKDSPELRAMLHLPDPAKA
jgi:hypothetical protein